jgi:hypothetical protein
MASRPDEMKSFMREKGGWHTLGMLRIVLFVLSSLLLLSCSNSERTQPGMLHIEPVDLFAGDAQKFKPFLGDVRGRQSVLRRKERDDPGCG